MLKIKIDDHVPPSILRDIRRTVDQLRAQGGSNFLIQLPPDEFGQVMDIVVKEVHVPFTPTLLDLPCAPWDQPFVGVMARPAATVPAPMLYGPDGRELAEVR
jgi:hypothetical protein